MFFDDPGRADFRTSPTIVHPARRERMAGLYFEEFEEGQIFEHAISRTVTEMDNVLFSTLTMNPQPLHLDEEFAKQTEFGQRLVNSLFTLGLVIGISVGETTLGTTVANLGMSEVSFPKPVFHGDTLRARTTILSKRRSRSRTDAGIVEFEHRGINQRGETVAICKRAGLMKCRSAEA
jgi:acyl dehydratase